MGVIFERKRIIYLVWGVSLRGLQMNCVTSALTSLIFSSGVLFSSKIASTCLAMISLPKERASAAVRFGTDGVGAVFIQKFSRFSKGTKITSISGLSQILKGLLEGIQVILEDNLSTHGVTLALLILRLYSLSVQSFDGEFGTQTLIKEFDRNVG